MNNTLLIRENILKLELSTINKYIDIIRKQFRKWKEQIEVKKEKTKISIYFNPNTKNSRSKTNYQYFRNKRWKNQ